MYIKHTYNILYAYTIALKKIKCTEGLTKAAVIKVTKYIRTKRNAYCLVRATVVLNNFN